MIHPNTEILFVPNRKVSVGTHIVSDFNLVRYLRIFTACRHVIVNNIVMEIGMVYKVRIVRMYCAQLRVN